MCNGWGMKLRLSGSVFVVAAIFASLSWASETLGKFPAVGVDAIGERIPLLLGVVFGHFVSLCFPLFCMFVLLILS